MGKPRRVIRAQSKRVLLLGVRGMHVKVGGKPVFINKYTRRIPGYNYALLRVDSFTISGHIRASRKKEYERWFKDHYPSQTELNEQKSTQKKFKERPLISILVPTYNTNLKHLKECIESALAQTYDNWELCIADDNSSKPKVREVIKQYADKDGRIKYVFREKNGHICRASNSALELANGDYITLLDHDDLLWPDALYRVVEFINKHPDVKFVYGDEDKVEENGNKHSEPFFKPDWSYEFLRSINYITHSAFIDRRLVNKVGGFRPGYEGAQDWDLFLRTTRELDKVYHIPTILYSWRKSSTSTAQASSAKDYAYVNQKKVLEDDIKVRDLKATLSWQVPFSMWRVDYEVEGNPLVSIIIPTKDQFGYISRCLKSIVSKTTYNNYELVIVDTGSTDKRVWDLYEEYKKQVKHLKIAIWDKPFNFSSACDLGADKASGQYFMFLNNDTEVIEGDWLGDMLGYAQQDRVGAVGCKLLYPDRKLQHAGVILGVGGQHGTPGIAGHFYPGYIDNPPQDPTQLTYVGGTRNFAAVTAACVMISKKKFNEVKGFDPIFQIAFNDIDFCLKLLKAGYRNVYLPHVALFHYESVSVGQPGEKQRDLTVFKKEIELMLKKWQPLIINDPYYHPEFRRDIANARLKP